MANERFVALAASLAIAIFPLATRAQYMPTVARSEELKAFLRRPDEQQ
jgi:hypothetical protein